ncbi:MAG TPA: hypothetical protein VIT22_03410 [Pseudoxanthomonas sp.]
MNAKHFLPPVATALLAVAAVSALVDNPTVSVAEASPHTVDLAAITVRPAVEDAAYYQSRHVVDLPAVIVYPDIGDLAFFVTDTVRIADCLC